MGPIRWVRPAAVGLAALAGAALLLAHTALARDTELDKLRLSRRYRDDLGLAISRYLASHSAVRAEPLAFRTWRAQTLIDRYHRLVRERLERERIRPWQFWRTIRVWRFIGKGPIEGRPWDDPGRALLMGLGFRLLGGVAPYLGLWLGALVCVPVLLWASWELAKAGLPVAAGLVPLTVALSPYVVEVLSFPYSAVGFYVLGALLIVPFATHALHGPTSTAGPLLLRCLAAGVGLAICTLCRSGSLLLFPGFALAAFIAARRSTSGTGRLRRSLALGLAACVLLLAPHVAVRRPQHRQPWTNLWEGLGDFDRTRGHVWFDPAARQALKRAGVAVKHGEPVEDPRFDGTFKKLVLDDIREDPGWYVTILAKRVAATTTQSKLWAWAPRERQSFTPSSHRNEGVIDVYYRMTTTADHLGFASWRVELPMTLFVLPTVGMLGAALLGRRLAMNPVTRRRSVRALGILGCIAVATLALPVLVTTASGPETQAFALVYLLGIPLAIDLSVAGLTAGSPAPGAAPLPRG